METGQHHDTLEQLRAQLQEWRKNHHAPTPIPTEIWDKAAELAADVGVPAISRELRLDAHRLRMRSGQAPGARPRRSRPGRRPARPKGTAVMNGSPSQASFLELLTPLPGHISECSLEVESPTGARLKVLVKNLAAAGLAAILREFAV